MNYNIIILYTAANRCRRRGVLFFHYIYFYRFVPTNVPTCYSPLLKIKTNDYNIRTAATILLAATQRGGQEYIKLSHLRGLPP